VTATGNGRLELGAAPSLGPVTAVTAAGKDLAGAQSEVGLIPEIRWGAPTLGSAGGYEVEVHQLEPVRGRVATISTTATSVRIPGELLEAGARYFLKIRAISAGNTDLAATPLKRSLPESFTEMVTAPFAP
jgi:hypothetical protein